VKPAASLQYSTVNADVDMLGDADDPEKKRKADEESTSAREAKKADTTASPMKRRNQPQEPSRDNPIRPPQWDSLGKENKSSKDISTAKFVDSFFQSPVPFQKEVIETLLSDPRATPILPAGLSRVSRRTTPSTQAVSTQTQGSSQQASAQTDISIKPTSLRSDIARMTVEHDKRIVQLSDQSKYRLLQTDAFDYLRPTVSGGAPGAHRSLVNSNDANFNLRLAAMKSLNRSARSICDFVMGLCLSAEQRRLALWQAFGRSGLREIVQSFGFNTREVRIGQLMAQNVSRFMQKVRSTGHSHGRVSDAQRLVVNSILTGSISTPQRSSGQERRAGQPSDRAVLGALGLPLGSHHLLRQCRENRVQSKEEGQYNFLGPVPQRRTKVSDETWDELRNEWLPNHQNVSDTPTKNDTVMKRDRLGNIVRGRNNEPVHVQKQLARVSPREFHNSMIEPVEKGGFAGARGENGEVLISLTAMRRYWPNWIVPMTKRYKEMCVCVLCGIPNGLAKSLHLWRRRTIDGLERALAGMPLGRAKAQKEEELNEYKSEVFAGGPKADKRMSSYLNMIACPPVTLATCPDCPKYKPNNYESKCGGLIRYTLMDKVRCCSWHGDGFIVQDGSKWTCSKCDAMTDEEKAKTKKKPAKVSNRTFRRMFCVPVSTFVEPDGVFQIHLEKYLWHRFHRTFLGGSIGLEMAHQYVKNRPGEALITNRDWADAWKKAAFGQFQQEHFGNSETVNIEGCTAKYCLPCGTERFNFYSHLTDMKRRDGSTVAENIRTMLYDLFDRGDLTLGTLKVLVSIVDGCAVQYRCGTVCYQLCKLAKEFNIVYDRFVQAPGHGKCTVDATNGMDKTLLDLFFSCLVADPEELESGMKRVLTHTRGEDGEEISLAEVCYNILNDPDRTMGSKSHEKRSKDRKIHEKRYFLLLERDVDGVGVKFVLKGFEDGKHNGIGCHYNLRADPQLFDIGRMRIAIRRFPCFCEGCVAKLNEPIETRYAGHSDTCDYWPIFLGENDWKIIDIVRSDNGFDEGDVESSKANALQTIGWRNKQSIEIGNYGAYPCDDDGNDYYIVKFMEEPHEVDKDETLQITNDYGTEEFPVAKGDWICRAIWLEKLPGTKSWYFETKHECIVRCQYLIITDLKLVPLGPTNQLHGGAPRSVKNNAVRYEAMRVTDEDHDFMMNEATSREAFDFEENFDGSSSEEEDEEDGDSDTDEGSDLE